MNIEAGSLRFASHYGNYWSKTAFQVTFQAYNPDYDMTNILSSSSNVRFFGFTVWAILAMKLSVSSSQNNAHYQLRNG